MFFRFNFFLLYSLFFFNNNYTKFFYQHTISLSEVDENSRKYRKEIQNINKKININKWINEFYSFWIFIPEFYLRSDFVSSICVCDFHWEYLIWSWLMREKEKKIIETFYYFPVSDDKYKLTAKFSFLNKKVSFAISKLTFSLRKNFRLFIYFDAVNVCYSNINFKFNYL